MTYRLLWGALILTWGVGDLLTTALGLHVGLAEQNPLMVVVLEQSGITGFAVLKAAALVVVYTLWKPLDGEHSRTAPLYLFIFFGAFLTAGNAFTIAMHTGAL